MKKLLYLLPLLLIVLAAVFVPRLLLRGSEDALLQKRYRRDASGSILSAPSESLVEKLALLADEESILMYSTSIDGSVELREALRAEIRSLYALGAIGEELYESCEILIDEELFGNRVFLYSEARGKIFELYDLYAGHYNNVHFLIDAESGKILVLNTNTQAHTWFYFDCEQMPSAQQMEALAGAWASYFGATAVDYSLDQAQLEQTLDRVTKGEDAAETEVIFTALLRDDAGNVVRFCKALGGDIQYQYGWQPLTAASETMTDAAENAG